MTVEISIPETQVPVTPTETGCLGQVGWFLSGAVLPFSSLSYYRKAAQRSVGSAVLFFTVFTFVITALVSIGIAVDMLSLIAPIRQAYADGDVPAITIANGIAEVDGKQPYVMIDGADSNGRHLFVAVDTTGEIQEINPDAYQGFLLTRTELHILTPQNGYQTVPLSDINASFEKDPIIIDADTVSQAWALLSIIIVLFAFVFLLLWNTVFRLMVILAIALVIWGIVVLLKPKTGFEPIIITGLYAIVPAIYLSLLFKRTDISFPGLQTVFLLTFWTIGLLANFLNVKFIAEERPLHLWTALLGVPVLLLYIVDLFAKFPSPYGVAALWAASMLTGLVIIGLRLYLRFNRQNLPKPLAE